MKCKFCGNEVPQSYLIFDDSEQAFFCSECFEQYLVDAFPDQIAHDDVYYARGGA